MQSTVGICRKKPVGGGDFSGIWKIYLFNFFDMRQVGAGLKLRNQFR